MLYKQEIYDYLKENNIWHEIRHIPALYSSLHNLTYVSAHIDLRTANHTWQSGIQSSGKEMKLI